MSYLYEQLIYDTIFLGLCNTTVFFYLKSLYFLITISYTNWSYFDSTDKLEVVTDFFLYFFSSCKLIFSSCMSEIASSMCWDRSLVTDAGVYSGSWLKEKLFFKTLFHWYYPKGFFNQDWFIIQDIGFQIALPPVKLYLYWFNIYFACVIIYEIVLQSLKQYFTLSKVRLSNAISRLFLLLISAASYADTYWLYHYFLSWDMISAQIYKKKPRTNRHYKSFIENSCSFYDAKNYGYNSSTLSRDRNYLTGKVLESRCNHNLRSFKLENGIIREAEIKFTNTLVYDKYYLDSLYYSLTGFTDAYPDEGHIFACWYPAVTIKSPNFFCEGFPRYTLYSRNELFIEKNYIALLPVVKIHPFYNEKPFFNQFFPFTKYQLVKQAYPLTGSQGEARLLLSLPALSAAQQNNVKLLLWEHPAKSPNYLLKLLYLFSPANTLTVSKEVYSTGLSYCRAPYKFFAHHVFLKMHYREPFLNELDLPDYNERFWEKALTYSQSNEHYSFLAKRYSKFLVSYEANSLRTNILSILGISCNYDMVKEEDFWDYFGRFLDTHLPKFYQKQFHYNYFKYLISVHILPTTKPITKADSYYLFAKYNIPVLWDTRVDYLFYFTFF